MKYLLIILFFCPLFIFSQNDFPNTILMDSTMNSPKADLGSLDWIAGHWKGASFGGVTEEIWSPKLGNSMMGSFKLVVKNEIQFYEILTISEENGSLMLRILHFDKALNGWEERGNPEEFPLVKITPNKVFFNGLTFEKKSKKKIVVYVVIEQDGKKEEMAFPYVRRRKLKG